MACVRVCVSVCVGVHVRVLRYGLSDTTVITRDNNHSRNRKIWSIDDLYMIGKTQKPLHPCSPWHTTTVTLESLCRYIAFLCDATKSLVNITQESSCYSCLSTCPA